MDIDTEKLELMFRVKYKSLEVEDPDITYDNWIRYCDKNNIFLLHPDWLVETLNEEGLKRRVCIHSPEHQKLQIASPWLLVPRKFAEKAMVLGFVA